MGITHSFTSAEAEGADPTKVRTSNWNADHVFAGVLDAGSTVGENLPAGTLNLAVPGTYATVSAALAALEDVRIPPGRLVSIDVTGEITDSFTIEHPDAARIVITGPVQTDSWSAISITTSTAVTDGRRYELTVTDGSIYTVDGYIVIPASYAELCGCHKVISVTGNDVVFDVINGDTSFLAAATSVTIPTVICLSAIINGTVTVESTTWGAGQGTSGGAESGMQGIVVKEAAGFAGSLLMTRAIASLVNCGLLGRVETMMSQLFTDKVGILPDPAIADNCIIARQSHMYLTNTPVSGGGTQSIVARTHSDIYMSGGGLVGATLLVPTNCSRITAIPGSAYIRRTAVSTVALNTLAADGSFVNTAMT